MVSSRIFPSPVGWMLGVLLCLCCTWPVIGSSVQFGLGVPYSCGTCLNGGLCLSSGGGGITCSCPQEYTGPSCEINTESEGLEILVVIAIVLGVLLVIGLHVACLIWKIYRCTKQRPGLLSTTSLIVDVGNI